MIRLPEFVTLEVFEHAKELLKVKKPYLNLDKVNYEIIEEGKCVQIMHLGSYDEENTSIEKYINLSKLMDYKLISMKSADIMKFI